MSKLLKLIKGYKKNRKRKEYLFKVKIENLFVITKAEEEWLCQEDKKLYNVQIKFQSKIRI